RYHVADLFKAQCQALLHLDSLGYEQARPLLVKTLEEATRLCRITIAGRIKIEGYFPTMESLVEKIQSSLKEFSLQ
ncbi:hypothetical protein KKA02_02385, partial [Patescibacteria group bacterium]|nr:hypothetical protein [Patescibacteria group bacterium]